MRRFVLLFAGLLLVVVGCGPQNLQPAEIKAGSTGDSSQCPTEHKRDLIARDHALRRATKEGVSGEQLGASRAETRLDLYRRHPTAEPVCVWVITYKDAVMPLHGPYGVEPGCTVGDWDIVIDATTGEYLVEGGTGQTTPCS